MASLGFKDQYRGQQAGSPMPQIDFGYQPSEMQQGFYRWLWEGKGNANVIAVAGSGKSTSIRGGLLFIPEEASVVILAFNYKIANEMKTKIAELGQEHGREFRKVQAKTFHSLGYGAVIKRLGKSYNEIEVTGGKSRRILRQKLPKEEYKMYGTFCAKLVGLAKGEGLGVGPGALGEPSVENLMNLVDHHDLRLESENADMDRALLISQRLLDYSTIAAQKHGLLDFDDQIYLPVLWDLRIWQNDFVFIDEAQDTNPVRRALARMALLPSGRLIAVGDPAQAIYGFTGASHDAMDLIKEEFDSVDLPLTVSYRCPKVAEELVKHLVGEFSVHPDAPEGAVHHMSVSKGLERLGQRDAVLCRNTAPLVDLAFQLLDQGRPCVILGKDIGANLIELIEKMEAINLQDLDAKLEAYMMRELKSLLEKGEDDKAEAMCDRIGSIRRLSYGLKEANRSVEGLIRKLQEMFSDDNKQGALTLCTGHKAKGLEWQRVALLEPGLMPSKWARQEHQYRQEKNLMYVVRTRFKEEFIFLDGIDGLEEQDKRNTAWANMLEELRQKFSKNKPETAVIPQTSGELEAEEAAQDQADDLAIPDFLKRS